MLQKGYQQASDLLLVFGLFFLSNASALVYVLWLTPEFVILEFVIWIILITICVWILKKDNFIPVFLDNLKQNWIAIPFLIFSGFSIFWSIYWEISLYRWLILVFTIVAGGYIGLRHDIKKILEFLSIFGIYILLFSTFLVFFVPRIGVMNYYIIQGAWKGIYWHKGHMGLIAAFINLLFLINVVYSMQSKEKNTLVWGLLYLFSLIFVYKTNSVAAYITAIFLHGVILLALILLKFGKNFRRPHYLFFFTVVIFGLIILYFNIDSIFGIFNRSTSLTGRVPMWDYLFSTYFNKRPYFGYGFNAFWYIESHRVALQHAAGYPDQIVIADNGFIDILVNTGLVGFVLFLIFYFGAWWRSIQYARKAKDIIGVFPLVLMSYTLLANISWSLIFENEGFFMLIMISILFCISYRAPINHQGR
jgi:exopolysaccharide production protein ExoQ